MKNIAIITSSLTGGGAERAAGLLSQQLSKHYNVFLFLIEDRPITYEYSGTLVKLHMTKMYKKRERLFGLLGRIFSKSAYITVIKEIHKNKKKLEIDCAISFLDTSNLMNIFSKGKERIIVSVRSTRSLQSDTTISKIENFGIKKFYNNTNRVVALSYGVADDLIHNFNIRPDLIDVIYNFCDIRTIKKKSLESVPEYISEKILDKKVIVSMGRLISVKNHLRLIDVCHELFSEIKDAVFVIIGNGELKEKILNHIHELDEESRIFLFDFQSNPFPVIAKADAFVMATEREGFCNSILEAMACETAVVSTDCLSGPREIIAGMTEYQTVIEENMYCDRGVLVPLNNNEQMKEALHRILSDEAYRVSCVKNANEYINNYSNEAISNQWIDIIEGI